LRLQGGKIFKKSPGLENKGYVNKELLGDCAATGTWPTHLQQSNLMPSSESTWVRGKILGGGNAMGEEEKWVSGLKGKQEGTRCRETSPYQGA